MAAMDLTLFSRKFLINETPKPAKIASGAYDKSENRTSCPNL